MISRGILLMGLVPFPFFKLKNYSMKVDNDFRFNSRVRIDGYKEIEFESMDKTISISFSYSPKNDSWVLGLMELLRINAESGKEVSLILSEGILTQSFLGKYVIKSFDEAEKSNAAGGLIPSFYDVELELEKIITKRLEFF